MTGRVAGREDVIEDDVSTFLIFSGLQTGYKSIDESMMTGRRGNSDVCSLIEI